MKAIKIIDLINRCLKKDETLPKGIIYRGTKYYLCKNSDVYCYLKETDDTYNLMRELNLVSRLNREVEIIEEKKDIAKINKSYPIFEFNEKSFEAMKDMLQDVYSKQVEIINAVNELKKEGK